MHSLADHCDSQRTQRVSQPMVLIVIVVHGGAPIADWPRAEFIIN